MIMCSSSIIVEEMDGQQSRAVRYYDYILVYIGIYE